MRNYKNIFQNHLHSLHRYHIIELLKKTYFSEQRIKVLRKAKRTANRNVFGPFYEHFYLLELPKDISERRAFLFICRMERYRAEYPWMGVNVL